MLDRHHVARPALVLGALAAYTAAGLAADRGVGGRGQLALGFLTWIVLVTILRWVPRARRPQVALVVAIATVGEVLASLVWGLYAYRLDNVPSFVPPGHGIVYIAGLSVAALFAGRERLLVAAAVTAAATWAVAGVTVLPRADVGGAIAAVLLVVVLARTRRPVYAGVFFVVAALELYGTAIGTWTWAQTIPGTAIANGNPPSGVASGYVLLDVIAIAGASRLAAIAPRLRRAPVPQTA